MTGPEVAALVVAVAATITLCVLLTVTVHLLRVVRRVHGVVSELEHEAAATVDEMRATLETARDDLDRATGLLVTAERIAAAAESTSRVTNQALSTPVVKAMAIAHGTGRAARRFRRPR